MPGGGQGEVCNIGVDKTRTERKAWVESQPQSCGDTPRASYLPLGARRCTVISKWLSRAEGMQTFLGADLAARFLLKTLLYWFLFYAHTISKGT